MGKRILTTLLVQFNIISQTRFGHHLVNATEVYRFGVTVEFAKTSHTSNFQVRFRNAKRSIQTSGVRAAAARSELLGMTAAPQPLMGRPHLRDSFQLSDT